MSTAVDEEASYSSIDQVISRLKSRNGGEAKDSTGGAGEDVIEWKDMTQEQKQTAVRRRFKKCIIYVKNLPYKLSSEDLKTLFSKFGEVVQIAKGDESATMGTAFVVFNKPKEAMAAMNALRGFKVQERYLIIQPYDPETMREKIEQQVERRRKQLEAGGNAKGKTQAKKQRLT